MTLLVTRESLVLSIQDGGRFGYRRFGLPESGPVDWWAHHAANRLVGNPSHAACVELGFTGAAFEVQADALLACCGAGFVLRRNDQPLPLWMAFWARRGDTLSLVKTRGGNWAYLAAAGGILTPLWLGSRSVYPRAFLGRLLIRGDRLPLGRCGPEQRLLAGRALPMTARPGYAAGEALGVIPGPHADHFSAEGLAAFWQGHFGVSSSVDRMGYRLVGPAVAHRGQRELISLGVPAGAVQVPPDGQPIVMMPDHPTTGGYPCIGAVARTSLPLLAQAQPGIAEVVFYPVDENRAREDFQKAMMKLETQLEDQEALWPIA